MLYILSVGDSWKKIFSRTFGLATSSWLNRIFSWLTVFLLLSFVSSIFIISYLLSPISYFYIYLTVALLSYLLSAFWSRKKVNIAVEEESEDQRNLVLFKLSRLWPCLYLLVWALGFYLSISQTSGEILFSPWQDISEFYLPVFFVLTLLSGIFLFAKFKTKTILFILVLQSILLSSYLPLSHKLPWGGDVWRHLAVEKQLQAGEPILPVLFGPEAGWREVAGINLPEVFSAPQKFAYGQLWGISVALAETLRVDLVVVNRWLIPILWLIVMPFVLFRIGWLIFGSRRKGLWLAWLSFLAFPFQALGALTLPVSLGYLTFFFVLMLWLQYWRDSGRSQRRYALLFSALMIFGYSLHFILIWLVVLLSLISLRQAQGRLYLLSRISRNMEYGTWNRLRKILITGTVFVFSVIVISVIEILSGYSSFNPANWFNNLKQLVGQFSGWFYASMIRPHDILTGNIFFNHTPDYAFVENIFSSWRWWLLPMMVILICLFIFSFISVWRNQTERRWRVLLNLTGAVIGGYLLSWTFLAGDHLLTRRLDLMFVFLWIIFLIYILSKLLNGWQARRWVTRAVVLLAVFGLSWFGALTYASGPDMRILSGDEYSIANFVWDRANIGSPKSEVRSPYCVLADTWVLLPLEGLSSGRIIGGGFPIDYQFGQKERVEILEKFAQNPEAGDLEQMKQLTGAGDCWFIYPENKLDSEIANRITEIIGNQPKQSSGFLIWGKGLQKEGE
ncbi:MAG: hypothetical protein A2921_01925 [Candidatus Magasanikbacteria bacterium RIFCSPLOWO2_01_FULL_43_20b]|nr:MAG: hypothetical protein A2921_01925 [Candidatus Magasanikbacteria bacterium RIFCSPLOWO2_01_FULL_43_20b]